MSVTERPLCEQSKFLTTSRMVRLFSKGMKAPEKGMRVIYMDGAFDMMHYGHMNAFRQGAALGTYLIVGVNSDASITVNKGQPVCNDDERLQCVAGCKFVDEVVTDVPYVMSPEYVKHIIEKYDLDYIKMRVNYYNKIDRDINLSDNVSNLSARAKDTPNILLGNESPENFGL